MFVLNNYIVLSSSNVVLSGQEVRKVLLLLSTLMYFSESEFLLLHVHTCLMLPDSNH